MEDFLIPDRARIAVVLRELAATDRAHRPTQSFSSNGNGSAPVLAQAAASLAWDEVQRIPQASSVIEVDLTRVAQQLDRSKEAWRERDVEPSYTPFFAEALLAALQRVPRAHAAFDASASAIRRYVNVHLGLSVMAADGSGARHAVVRDADTRNVLGLAVEAHNVRVHGAQDNGVLAEATITLADYGPDSALFAVPLVLPGQAAAVRIGAVEERLVARDRGMALAPTAFVCASIDHRALDGADAGALLNALKQFLETYPVQQ